jgi:hypothetical protein
MAARTKFQEASTKAQTITKGQNANVRNGPGSEVGMAVWNIRPLRFARG